MADALVTKIATEVVGMKGGRRKDEIMVIEGGAMKATKIIIGAGSKTDFGENVTAKTVYMSVIAQHGMKAIARNLEIIMAIVYDDCKLIYNGWDCCSSLATITSRCRQQNFSIPL